MLRQATLSKANDPSSRYLAPLNVLVIGGDSMIGSSLVNSLRAKGCQVFETTRRLESVNTTRFYLDLKNVPVDFSDSLSKWEISSVILCGCVTSSADCEGDPSGSRKVNVVGNLAVAKQFLSGDAQVIFLSSSAVFDGRVARPTAADTPSPCSEYGRQKLLVEKTLLETSGKTCILRLTKVLGSENKLLGHWVNELRSGYIIRPYGDASIAPIGLDYCAEVIFNIIRHKRLGIFHAAPTRQLTYYEVARHIANRIGAPSALIAPLNGKDTGSSFTRNSNLGGVISGNGIPPSPKPYEAIERFLSAS